MTCAVQFALVPSFSALAFDDNAPISEAIFHVLKARSRKEDPDELAKAIANQTGVTKVGDLRSFTDLEWLTLEVPVICRIYLKHLVRQSARREKGGKTFIELLQDDFNYGQPYDISLYQNHIDMLGAMGFSSDEAMEALVITENKGIEPALELLFQEDRSIRTKRREEAKEKLGRVVPVSEVEVQGNSDLIRIKRSLDTERAQRLSLEVDLKSVQTTARFQNYKNYLRGMIASEHLSPDSFERLQNYRTQYNISEVEHGQALTALAVSEADFENMKKFENGDKKDNECVVCLDKPKDHVIMNCMHLCLCEDCAVDFSEPKAKCPMCNNRVRKVMKIFT